MADELTVLDEPFDPAAVNLDDIVPASTLDPQTALAILSARRDVGELMFAREEDLCRAEVYDAEAEEIEAKAENEDGTQKRRLAALARRRRLLAERSRWRARHRELEILSHMKRKDG